jgi:TetR/AcrR family transcriptional regulator, copper-responsive repressor
MRISTNMPGKRGRPRLYDPDTALNQATALFWNQGYAETSLDDLVQATGMNRPSLYGAFGDKKALYLAALERYRATNKQAIDQVLGRDEPLRAALTRFYRAALELYLAGAAGARGCFLIGTATTEAVVDPEIRTMLQQALHDFDGKLEARLRLAIQRGELPASVDPAQMARILSAILHSFAVRARAGDTRAALEATAAATIDLICGSG